LTSSIPDPTDVIVPAVDTTPLGIPIAEPSVETGAGDGDGDDDPVAPCVDEAFCTDVAAIDVLHDPVPLTSTFSPTVSGPPVIVVDDVVVTLIRPCGEPVFRMNKVPTMYVIVPEAEIAVDEAVTAAAFAPIGRMEPPADAPEAPPPPPHADKTSATDAQINSCFIATLQSERSQARLTLVT
jgi:hypothetical protein